MTKKPIRIRRSRADSVINPEVFIIESLTFEDEETGRPEGQFLSHILNLHGKTAIYYYIRTMKEFEEILKIFKRQAYRYLHLSCHGSSDELYTTIDSIPFSELIDIMTPYLKKRRLFISASEAINEDLAEDLFFYTECLSLIGPIEEVYFEDDAIAWASFYHLVFKKDPKGMERGIILSSLQKIVNAFEVPFQYYSRDSEADEGYHSTLIKPQLY